MSIRYFFAMAAGRVSRFALRALNRSGTALPGLVATTIDPEFLAHAGSDLTTTLITGTNGKTTTTNLLIHILKTANRTVLENRAGSNLRRGIASTLLSRSRYIREAIFETDEAELLSVTTAFRPKLVVLLNLFRDQLDRYGELDATIRQWRKLFDQSKRQTVLLNADDPGLGWLGHNQSNAQFMGIANVIGSKPGTNVPLPHTADTVISPESGELLVYHQVHFSHLGDYRDPKGKFKRPKLDYAFTNVRLLGMEGSSFTVMEANKAVIARVITPLPGMFNVYNVGAAVIAAHALGVDQQTIKAAVKSFHGAFGRFETITLPTGRTLVLFLVKNPVGFDVVLDLLRQRKEPYDLLIGINDLLADGIDVSWLWDVNFESAALAARSVLATGTRAHALALRLAYAQPAPKNIHVANSLANALATLEQSGKGTTICCLSYTAMLAFRALLVEKGLVNESFQQPMEPR